MTDQAEGLRRLARLVREAENSDFDSEWRDFPSGLKVVSITSGKGGVGKTNITINLAIALARRGERVVVLDADLGLANIDVLLGLYPKYNLGHLINGKANIEDVMITGPEGVRIIPGASGVKELADLSDKERMDFISRLDRIDYEADIMLIDTGAGLSKNVMDFLKASDEVIVVTTPEPTAITDAYALMKLLYQIAEYPKIKLLVNQVKGEQEAKRVAEQLSMVVKRFLNASFEELGYVLTDPAVNRAVFAQKPFILAYPNSYASYCVKMIADRLCEEGESRSGSGLKAFFKKMMHSLVKEDWA